MHVSMGRSGSCPTIAAARRLNFPTGSAGMTAKAVGSLGNAWVHGVKLHGCFTALGAAIERAVAAYPGLPLVRCPAFLFRGGFAGSRNDAASSAFSVDG